MRRVAILEGKVNQLDRSMGYAEQQLAHHYEYDADLGTRLDAHDGRADVRDEAVDGLADDWRFWKNIAVLEEHSLEGIFFLKSHVGAVRYGLMEIGGFVRFNILSRDQRQCMLTQERTNFLIWSQRTRAETTDAVTIPERFREISESAEGEVPTDDEVTGRQCIPW